MAEIKISKACLLLMFIGALGSCKGISVPETNINNFTQFASAAFVDMGVDYCDEPVPDYLKKNLANITLNDDSVTNKYRDQEGNLRLPKAIAALYSKLINRTLDPLNEIITTVGGTEALFSSIRGLSSVGDEWIIIEPFYSKFQRQIEFSNAVPRFTTLKSTKMGGNESAIDWVLNRKEMASLINNKTRGIVFNNPNNPLGKTYNRSDLDFIAGLSKNHNLVIVSDEVHEFTSDSIIRMASLPGMFNRTVTVGSASKAFSVPGWRIGWVYGPAELINKIKKVHGEVVVSASLPQQVAVSYIFDDEAKNFGSSKTLLAKNLASVKRKRQFIVQAFRKAGMSPIAPQGGYCMLASWPSLLKGTDFANWMRETIAVVGFTAADYYSQKNRHLGVEHLRLCYHKSNETLENAATNLMKLRTFETKVQQANVPPAEVREELLHIFYSNQPIPSKEKFEQIAHSFEKH